MDTILEKINKASLKFLEPLTPSKTYEIIVEEAKKLMGAEYGSIFLEKKGELERIYASLSILHRIKVKRNAPVYSTFQSNIPTAIDSNTVKGLDPAVNKMGIKSFVLIPLSYKEESIGVLSVLSLTKKSFTQKEFEALKLFGSMASLAIRKTQLYDETKKALEDRDRYKSMENVLEDIHKAGMKFLEPLTPEKTYSTIVKEAMNLAKADYGSILIEKEGELQRIYASSPVLFAIKVRKRGFTYNAFKKRTPSIIGIDKIGKIHLKVRALGIKSTIFIPLFYKDESIGVLSVDTSRKESFSKSEFRILKLFGSLASLAIKKTQLYDEVIKSLEVRDLFIALAAHELRTPLTTINGYIQLLQTHISKLGINEAKWIEHISEESQRLTKLVSELLEINRIKAGQLQFTFTECNLVDIIKNAASKFRFIYPGRKITLNNSLKRGEDRTIGDFDKLIQVFTNILENAHKFSTDESIIKVSLKKDGSFINIEIQDRGKGIRKEDLPRVFEGFYKGKNRNEEGGMGLGLYLAKSILEKHHGTIKIDSRIHKGTIVEIKLPQAHI